MQEFRHRACGLLGAVLEGARAPDPEEVVDLVEALDVGADDRDVEGQVLGPVHPGARGHTPRVALALHVLEERAQLAGEGALDESLVAAHFDDVVDVLDVDGALLTQAPQVTQDQRTSGSITAPPSGEVGSPSVAPTSGRTAAS
jgi:hypothetical protein